MGPAARGDIYRASERRARAICLIDGYFEHRPAVTHKEILWALKRGIPVFGAASLGALRAAELARYGMIGSGSVYTAFAQGELENEDEVAVPHGPEPEFRSGAEALVNVRPTLKAAVSAGIIDSDLCRELLASAKALFYPERNYGRLLGDAAERPLNLDPRVLKRLAALKDWLSDPLHRVDQKQLDARALLCDVRAAWLANSLPVVQPEWSFPETSSWRIWTAEWSDEPLQSRSVAEQASRAERQSELERAVIEEVQLLGPEVHSEIFSSAAVRALCVALLGNADSQPESSVRRVLPGAQRLIRRQIPEVLRLLGDYERVLIRAAEKQRTCSNAEGWRFDGASVLKWYFGRLRRQVPDDLAAFAMELGFASEDDFVRAVTREEAFVRWSLTRKQS